MDELLYGLQTEPGLCQSRVFLVISKGTRDSAQGKLREKSPSLKTEISRRERRAHVAKCVIEFGKKNQGRTITQAEIDQCLEE